MSAAGLANWGERLADSADIRVTGLERAPRGNELIPVAAYDGGAIPFPDGNFDAVILADVLHHERNPERLIGECARVARRLLIIKDHKADTWFQIKWVSLMDWAANAPYDVPVPLSLPQPGGLGRSAPPHASPGDRSAERHGFVSSDGEPDLRRQAAIHGDRRRGRAQRLIVATLAADRSSSQGRGDQPRHPVA